MIQTKGKAVILFDGICNLCNGAVQFTIRRDHQHRFLYASLQSDYAKNVMRSFGQDPERLHSIFLLEDGALYERSEAALRIGSQLKGFHWLRGLRYIPRVIRDGVYDLISRSRYRIFGKRDSCMIPTPELKALFIE